MLGGATFGHVRGHLRAKWPRLLSDRPTAARAVARQDLRPLAASLLLFVAGFGVSAPDLSAGAAARAVLPPTFELAGATLFGIAGMGLPILQAPHTGAFLQRSLVGALQLVTSVVRPRVHVLQLPAAPDVCGRRLHALLHP